MRTAALLAAAIVGLSATAVMAGTEVPIEDLLAAERHANDQCRGGSGDKPETWDACAERDRLHRQLNARGCCYGEPGQYGYQMVWHPCPKTFVGS